MATAVQQPDSLTSFAQSQAGVNYDGPRSIRERDMVMQQFVPAAKAPQPDPNFCVWNNERGDHGRPASFQPNGSFAALRLAGKLSDSQTEQFESARTTMKEKKYFMPGYTGFVRGSQHISGRTFGEMTRRAYDTDYREHICTSPIPSAPQCNRKVKHQMPPNSFMSNLSKNDGQKHVPGYTGHVPGVRQVYAKSFGQSTQQEMSIFSNGHPRNNPQEKDNFAATSRPRQMLHIDSAPLPGAPRLEDAPDKLIPAHLKYLRFFPL